jgi:hypothetical protein
LLRIVGHSLINGFLASNRTGGPRGSIIWRFRANGA